MSVVQFVSACQRACTYGEKDCESGARRNGKESHVSALTGEIVAREVALGALGETPQKTRNAKKCLCVLFREEREEARQ